MPDSVKNVLLAVLAVVVLSGAAYAVKATGSAAPVTGVIATAPSPSPSPVRAIFFGDSIIAGTGATNGRSMAAAAADSLGWIPNIMGFGGTGYTTGGPLGGKPYPKRVPVEMAGYTVEVVILQGGTNDAPGAALTAAASTTVREVKATVPGARIVMVGPYTPDAPTATDRQKDADLAKVASGAGVTYISPVTEGWSVGFRSAGLLIADDFHPNSTGHARLGARLADDLRRLHIARK